LGGSAGGVIGVFLFSQLVAIIGVFFCYFPAFLAMPFMAMAVPMVAVDGRSAGAAISETWRHMKAHPKWHLVLHLLTLATGMAFYFIPIVGLLLIYPWMYGLYMRAYRSEFPRQDSF